jgi:hypothetical protein
MMQKILKEEIIGQPVDQNGASNGHHITENISKRRMVVAVDQVSTEGKEGESSEVYYPIDVLPKAFQALGVISPATYVLDGVRQALLEGASTASLWPLIWPVLLIGLALIPLGLWVFGIAERYAKRASKLARNG